MKLLLILVMINQAVMSSAHSRCGDRSCQFVPAKPGHTPSCAANGSTFCESIHDYPGAIVEKLIKSTKIAGQFIIDEIQNDYKAKPDKRAKDFSNHHPFASSFRGYDSNRHFNGNFDSSDSSQEPDFHPARYGYGDYQPRKHNAYNDFIKSISSRGKRQANLNNEELCEVRTNFINPQAALNTNGNWMYVVQQTAATQLVRTEICTSTQCSNLCQLPNNYVSRCEQKYVQKRLIALDASGERLYTDTFWFPSCCACTLSVASR